MQSDTIATNFKYDADVSILEGTTGSKNGLLFRVSELGQNTNILSLKGYAVAFLVGTNKVQLLKYTNGTSAYTLLKEGTLASNILIDNTYHVTITCEGPNIGVDVNNVNIISIADNSVTYYPEGKVGAFSQDAGMSIDNMVVSAIGNFYSNARSFIPENQAGDIKIEIPDQEVGRWSTVAGKYVFTPNSNVNNSTAKILAIDSQNNDGLKYTDFVFEGDVKVNSGSTNAEAGLVFRDFYKLMLRPGYGVKLSKTLFSSRYVEALNSQTTTSTKYIGQQLMATVNPLNTNKINADTTYHVKIIAMGLNIKVYVNDMNVPVIDYNDIYVDGYNESGNVNSAIQYKDN